jgi:hypothetical protein
MTLVESGTELARLPVDRVVQALQQQLPRFATQF